MEGIVNDGSVNINSNHEKSTLISVPGSISKFMKSDSPSRYETFEPLSFATNYVSIFAEPLEKNNNDKICLENEKLLKCYYEYRSAFSNIMNHTVNSATNSYTNLSSMNDIQFNPDQHRHGSITSSIETSILQNERQSIYKVLNDFLIHKEHKLNPSILQKIMKMDRSQFYRDSPFRPHFDNNDNKSDKNMENLNNEAGDNNDTYFNSTKPYLLYYKKPLSVKFRDSEVIHRHNLWMPVVKRKYHYILKPEKLQQTLDYREPSEEAAAIYRDYFTSKACPLFIKGLDFVPKNYDTYSGTSIVPSIFADYKMPGLVYHCSVHLNNNIYIIGGLTACYRFDEEAPDLSDFYVDPIKNLPPPLLSKLINNPSLISNPFLYVYSTLQSRFGKPDFSGNAPPPLICAKGSIINDRYIFYYGGFEIKTETKKDENGKYYLKKRAFVNNLGYILDTETLKFSKVEVINPGQGSERNNKFYPRFGHIQLSANIDLTNNSVTSSSENVSVLSSRRTSSHQLYYGSHHHYKSNHGNGQNNIRQPEELSSIAKKMPHSLGSDSKVTNDSETKIHNKTNLSPYKSIHSIFVFGGYTQTEDDQYKALDDMWRIDLPVEIRGKRGFIKFASKAELINLPKKEVWPSARAFSAFTISEVFPPIKESLESNLLKRLEEQYSIDTKNLTGNTSNLFGTTVGVKSDLGEAYHDLGPSIHSQFSSHISLNSLNKPSQQGSAVNLGAPTEHSNVISNSMTAFETRMQILYNSKGINIIMHGGSDHDEIYGDLWMFDIKNEVWSRSNLFAKEIKDKPRHECQGDISLAAPDEPRTIVEEVPVDLKLTGHDMAYEGHMLVLLGGITQTDLPSMYHDGPIDADSEPRPLLGQNTVNIFDMETSTLQGYKIRKNAQGHYEYIYEQDKPKKSHSVMTTAGATVHINGSLFVVGGILALRSNLKDLKLRATVLQFVIPPISLSY
ncbi:Hypothetical protein J6897_03151 [Nakaseomyces glabratus]